MITTARWVYRTHSELATGAGSAAKQEKDIYVRNIKLVDWAKQSNKAFGREIPL